MFNALQSLTAYNQDVNHELFQILEPLTTEDLCQDQGSYYKSIMGLLNHILVSDYNWLLRFAQHGFCQAPSLVEVEGVFPGELAYEELEGWYKAREYLDTHYQQISINLSPEDWEEDFEYSNSQGAIIVQPLGLLLLHLFNHQTHHRGQISQILDAKGIPHDFSGLRQRYL
jgi:uncharacterized damage-inducible protein DinB